MLDKMQYPVLFLELNPSDPLFRPGQPFLIEQADEVDRHYFANREAAEAFMAVHDLKAISRDDMIAMRQAHLE